MKKKKIEQNIADSANREDEPFLDYMKKKIMNEEADKERER